MFFDSLRCDSIEETNCGCVVVAIRQLPDATSRQLRHPQLVSAYELFSSNSERLQMEG